MSALERYAPPATPIPQAERLSVDQLRYISATDLIPRAYRGNLPAIMACVLTGRALGLDDLHSLRAIHVVDGKATLSAELMVSLVRRAGHSLSGEISAEQATAKGKRHDTGDEMQVTWTLEDAKRAGLLGKGNWAKYPGSMLWARAVSQLVRMLFPDALLGLAYTADEMGDDAMVIDVPSVDSDGSVLEDGRPALDGPGEPFEGVDALQGSAAREASSGVAADNTSGEGPSGTAAGRESEATESADDAKHPRESPSSSSSPEPMSGAAETPAAPNPSVETPTAAAPDDLVIPKLISEKDRRKLFAIAKENGISTPRMKLIVDAVCGEPTSRGAIPADKFAAIVAAFEAEQAGDEQAEISPFTPPAGALEHRDPTS